MKPDMVKMELYTLPDKMRKEKGKVVNLLLISKGEKQHYCWIKNTTRLFSSQINKRKEAIHMCFNCMHKFKTEKALEAVSYTHLTLPTKA